MATYYVRSGAGGAGTGADWTNAYTTLALAISTAPAKVAGDTYYVADDHAESTASALTLTFPGTVTVPDRIICVNRAGTVPPVSADLRATATVSTTGANAINLAGFFYCYGIIFQSCVGASASSGNVNICSTAANQQRFDSCVFRCQNTAAGSNITTGIGVATYLNNCSMKLSHINSSIAVGRGRFFWSNSANAIDVSTAIPTNLFSAFGVPTNITLEGVDFSAMSSGKTLFNNGAGAITIVMKDCKLTSGVIISAAQTLGIGAADIQVIRSAPAVNYTIERYNSAGALVAEPTIVRTGGASDGTQGISYKVTTNASSQWAYPFTCFPISIWNDTIGSAVTVTVYAAVSGAVALPWKEEIWTDVEYLGTSGNPTGNFVTSGLADVLTPLATSAHATDASAWGGGTTTKFKMVATVTPQVKGPITVYVRVAKISTIYYIDPKVVLT